MSLRNHFLNKQTIQSDPVGLVKSDFDKPTELESRSVRSELDHQSPKRDPPALIEVTGSLDEEISERALPYRSGSDPVAKDLVEQARPMAQTPFETSTPINEPLAMDLDSQTSEPGTPSSIPEPKTLQSLYKIPREEHYEEAGTQKAKNSVPTREQHPPNEDALDRIFNTVERFSCPTDYHASRQQSGTHESSSSHRPATKNLTQRQPQPSAATSMNIDRMEQLSSASVNLDRKEQPMPSTPPKHTPSTVILKYRPSMSQKNYPPPVQTQPVSHVPKNPPSAVMKIHASPAHKASLSPIHTQVHQTSPSPIHTPVHKAPPSPMHTPVHTTSPSPIHSPVHKPAASPAHKTAPSPVHTSYRSPVKQVVSPKMPPPQVQRPAESTVQQNRFKQSQDKKDVLDIVFDGMERVACRVGQDGPYVVTDHKKDTLDHVFEAMERYTCQPGGSVKKAPLDTRKLQTPLLSPRKPATHYQDQRDVVDTMEHQPNRDWHQQGTSPRDAHEGSSEVTAQRSNDFSSRVKAQPANAGRLGDPAGHKGDILYGREGDLLDAFFGAVERTTCSHPPVVSREQEPERFVESPYDFERANSILAFEPVQRRELISPSRIGQARRVDVQPHRGTNKTQTHQVQKEVTKGARKDDFFEHIFEKVDYAFQQVEDTTTCHRGGQLSARERTNMNLAKLRAIQQLHG